MTRPDDFGPPCEGPRSVPAVPRPPARPFQYWLCNAGPTPGCVNRAEFGWSHDPVDEAELEVLRTMYKIPTLGMTDNVMVWACRALHTPQVLIDGQAPPGTNAD